MVGVELRAQRRLSGVTIAMFTAVASAVSDDSDDDAEVVEFVALPGGGGASKPAPAPKPARRDIREIKQEQAAAVEAQEVAKRQKTPELAPSAASTRARAERIEGLERKVTQGKKEGREAEAKLDRLKASVVEQEAKVADQFDLKCPGWRDVGISSNSILAYTHKND